MSTTSRHHPQRHTERHRRKPGTGSVRRPDRVDSRRRSRLSLGAGIFLFGLLCMIVAGMLGGPASPENGQGAMIMLIVAILGGAGGLALILWGLIAAE